MGDLIALLILGDADVRHLFWYPAIILIFGELGSGLFGHKAVLLRKPLNTHDIHNGVNKTIDFPVSFAVNLKI